MLHHKLPNLGGKGWVHLLTWPAKGLELLVVSKFSIQNWQALWTKTNNWTTIYGFMHRSILCYPNLFKTQDSKPMFFSTCFTISRGFEVGLFQGTAKNLPETPNEMLGWRWDSLWILMIVSSDQNFYLSHRNSSHRGVDLGLFQAVWNKETRKHR